MVWCANAPTCIACMQYQLANSNIPNLTNTKQAVGQTLVPWQQYLLTHQILTTIRDEIEVTIAHLHEIHIFTYSL